eukprot:TRINITY_DN473_c0_g1_i4.p1 TRINITY_DN473_c0_g1~~TRINITY_DN473_c0_g1_i4.p1  ORF type:complete len:232 (-),score=39.05 TRINITY_DN473_c0_g1_i4:284-979(-)
MILRSRKFNNKTSSTFTSSRSISSARKLNASALCFSNLHKPLTRWTIHNKAPGSLQRTFHLSLPVLMFIQAERTPNPESMKFYPGVKILEKGQVLDYPNARSTFNSPLAKRLFQLEGVGGVLLAHDYVTVTKNDPSIEWSALKPLVFNELMAFFSEGETQVVTDAAPPADTLPSEEDDEVVQQIKEILEVKVRPAVQEDGGDIQYVGFKEGVVFLKMVGSCKGILYSFLQI